MLRKTTTSRVQPNQLYCVRLDRWSAQAIFVQTLHCVSVRGASVDVSVSTLATVRENGPHFQFAWCAEDGSLSMHQSDGSRLSAVPVHLPKVASSWAAVSSVCSAKSASASPPTSESGEDVRSGPIPRIERRGGCGKGTCAEVGDSFGRDGRKGGTRDGFVASRPQTSTRSHAGIPRRRPNQRVRVVLGESTRPFGRVGLEAGQCQPEHRNVGEEVGRMEGSVTGCTCPNVAEGQQLRGMVSQ